MAEIVTIKELEEKYGRGFVVFKNMPPHYSSIPADGEYVFHSQTKSDCWALIDDTNSERMGIFPFGANTDYSTGYRVSSLYTMPHPLIVFQ